MGGTAESLYVLAITVEYSSLATPLQTPTAGEPGVKMDTFFEEFCSRLEKLGLQKPVPRQTHPVSLKNVFTYWSHENIMDSVRSREATINTLQKAQGNRAGNRRRVPSDVTRVFLHDIVKLNFGCFMSTDYITNIEKCDLFDFSGTKKKNGGKRNQAITEESISVSSEPIDQANEGSSSQSHLDLGVQTDAALCEDTMVLRERMRVLEQECVEYQSRMDMMVEELKAKDELLKRNQLTIFNLEEAKRTMENLVEAETNLSKTLRSRYSEVGRIHSTELGRRRKAEETLATVFNILRNPHHP